MMLGELAPELWVTERPLRRALGRLVSGLLCASALAVVGWAGSIRNPDVDRGIRRG